MVGFGRREMWKTGNQEYEKAPRSFSLWRGAGFDSCAGAGPSSGLQPTGGGVGETKIAMRRLRRRGVSAPIASVARASVRLTLRSACAGPDPIPMSQQKFL